MKLHTIKLTGTLLMGLMLLSSCSKDDKTSKQNILSENFDDVAVMKSNGWKLGTFAENESDFISVGAWGQGYTDAFTSHKGPANSFVSVDFSSAAGNGTISNWMYTPVVNIKNGDVISFYSRTYDNPAANPDRLEVRIGQGVNPTAPDGSSDVGGYTILAVSINPDLTSTGYPNTWTKYTYTVTGIATETPCKVAFRYYVTNGGTGAAAENADIIGVDTFSIDR